MLVLGYFLAVVVGFSLGVLGTGGAILTIPIFIYIWHFQDKQAVASGFVIVVLVGLLTAWKHYKDGHINFKLLTLFAPTTMIGTHLGVTLSQNLPGNVQLLMLAVIMSTSALLMLLPHHHSEIETLESNVVTKVDHPILFMILGFFIGGLVGLVGIGGGFIILPVLVSLAHVPMRQAIGTTLMIAILNSIVGGVSCLQHVIIPWERVLTFAAVAVVGGITGAYLSSKLPISVLKKAFATIMILVASAIVYENIAIMARGGSILSSLPQQILIK